MLARLPQVEHGLDAVGLELRERFEPRLSAGAELRADLQELRNRRHVGLGRGLEERERASSKESMRNYNAAASYCSRGSRVSFCGRT